MSSYRYTEFQLANCGSFPFLFFFLFSKLKVKFLYINQFRNNGKNAHFKTWNSAFHTWRSVRFSKTIVMKRIANLTKSCYYICKLLSLKYETWNAKCEMWNVKRETWRETCSVKHEIWNVKCETWNQRKKLLILDKFKFYRNFEQKSILPKKFLNPASSFICIFLTPLGMIPIFW